MSDRPPTVAFTVDLEPDCPPFLEGFRGIENGLPVVLELLATARVSATFFTTGDVAERYPHAVRRVVREGHELGCHGMTHRSFRTLSVGAAHDEINRSTAILRQFAPVTSFRAPYLELPARYVPLLADAGFRVDSSQAKYKADYIANYGRARDAGTVTRIAASATSSVLRLPKLARNVYLAALSDPVVLFVHPWEFIDLRRERIRFDCRFKTGEVAVECLRDVLARYAARGARFVTMRQLGEEREQPGAA